jgi:hypothetical protein
MVRDSLAAKDAAVADARQEHRNYVAESALAQLHISSQFRDAHVAMARDQAALIAMNASVAEARIIHIEHEIELVRGQLGLPKEYLKTNFELERNEELVALERALIEARDQHKKHSEELTLAQLRVSPGFLEVEQTMAETQAALVAKIVEDAHGWVLRAENERAATEKRLAATIGRVVLTGAALERDVDLVKGAVAHGTTLVESRRQRPEDQDYARWCLDVAIQQVTSEIKTAKPASNEKEMLELKLESLNDRYAKVTRNVRVSEDEYRQLIAETLTAPENNVNEEWLNAQREVLEARETVKVQLRGPQANLSLTH